MNIDDSVLYMAKHYDVKENAFAYGKDEEEEFKKHTEFITEYYKNLVKGSQGVVPMLHPWLLDKIARLKKTTATCPHCGGTIYIPKEQEPLIKL